MNTAQIAEALLLAMDGDFLPGAGMGVDNQGQDVPLDKARPKEVAWWAAEAIADWLAAHDESVRGDERERLAAVERERIAAIDAEILAEQRAQEEAMMGRKGKP